MALNVPLLRESFTLVTTREPQLVRRFYQILFERYPQAKVLFHRNTPENQDKMLTGALVAVLDHLEDAPWLQQTLSGLGTKHVEYGVTPKMYDWVGECLLAALAEVAGKDWTKELAAAWAEAYGAIVSMMLRDAPTTTAPTPAVTNEPTTVQR